MCGTRPLGQSQGPRNPEQYVGGSGMLLPIGCGRVGRVGAEPEGSTPGHREPHRPEVDFDGDHVEVTFREAGFSITTGPESVSAEPVIALGDNARAKATWLENLAVRQEIERWMNESEQFYKRQL